MFLCSIRCYSMVGNRRMGKQNLSIGAGCDSLGTVEHELLHALGFWHEQSRSDRDDYVTIMWDRIKEGHEHNFNLHNETESSSLGVPYDYGSVMHYSKKAFSIGTTASIFLDSCQFEEPNICGMIQGDGGNAKWARVQRVKGGPQTDYTNLGRCQGGLQGSWELYHVTLNVSDKFRVVFEGVKGRKPSKGGLSLDDMNLSETKCPQYTWRIRDFTRLLATTPAGSKTYSPRFLSPDGYSFQIGLYINGLKDSPNKTAVYFHLTSGPKDNNLQWPCPWRQASMELMDQNPDIQHRMNNIKMVTTDPTMTFTDSMGNVEYLWDNPQKVGSLVTDAGGSKYYRGPGYGTSNYVTHDRLKSRSFIKGDDVILLLSLEGV
ncbi:hypothetical protein cypCar_00043056 [Cyprinus carpio]|nr:hypothetical protein cypCar_00043056 [Cyprinus carpio]